MTRRAVIAALLLSLLTGCRTPAPDLIARGDALLAQKEYAEAAAVYQEVLNRSDVSDLDRRRAVIGEAQAFLYRGDLTGAETRLRRMPDNMSAKWYHLGEVAEGRRRPDEARRCFQRALDLVHGGDTARRLARLIAGEARSPVTLLQAAQVFKRGGALQEAEALRVLAQTWRDLDAGEDPKALLPRFGESVVSAYPSVRVLRARVEAAAGGSADWKLTGASEAFKRWAAELRAQEAIERGDVASLRRLLGEVDPATAARIRDATARALRHRGDLVGALAWYRETVAAGGAPAALASAEAAQLLERLGRLPEAAEAWKVALAASPTTPRLRLLQARRLARRGDLLGARSRLGKTPGGTGADRAEANRLVLAARRLHAALKAHEDGARARATAAARAVRALVPGDPAAGVLLARGNLDTIGQVRGETRAALFRALLTRRLRTGDLARAGALLRQGPASKLREVLQAELYGGVLAGLRAGRDAQVQAFLKAHREHLDLRTLRAATALDAYPDALLPKPRGVLAVGDGISWGTLWAPRSGFRRPLVGLQRKGDAVVLRLPAGGELVLPDLERLADQLGGGAARRLGWAPWVEPDAAEERAGAARAGGVGPVAPLEVE